MGRQRGDGFALMSPGQQILQLWIAGEVLDSERHTFDDGSDWVVESAGVVFNLIDEPVDRTH